MVHKDDAQAMCNETYHHNAGCIAPASKKDGGNGADFVSKAMAAGR